MPIEYWIDRDLKLLRFKLTGEFTTEEMLDSVGGALKDPFVGKGYDVLSDHTELTRFITVPEAEGVAQFLRANKQVTAGMNWAVVTVNPASYGMMRMLSVYVESIPIRLQVFASEREAMQWLRPGGG